MGGSHSRRARGRVGREGGQREEGGCNLPEEPAKKLLSAEEAVTHLHEEIAEKLLSMEEGSVTHALT